MAHNCERTVSIREDEPEDEVDRSLREYGYPESEPPGYEPPRWYKRAYYEQLWDICRTGEQPEKPLEPPEKLVSPAHNAKLIAHAHANLRRDEQSGPLVEAGRRMHQWRGVRDAGRRLKEGTNEDSLVNMSVREFDANAQRLQVDANQDPDTFTQAVADMTVASHLSPGQAALVSALKAVSAGDMRQALSLLGERLGERVGNPRAAYLITSHLRQLIDNRDPLVERLVNTPHLEAVLKLEEEVHERVDNADIAFDLIDVESAAKTSRMRRALIEHLSPAEIADQVTVAGQRAGHGGDAAMRNRRARAAKKLLA